MPLTLPMDVQSCFPQARYTVQHRSTQPNNPAEQTISEFAIYMVGAGEIMRSNGVYMANDHGWSARRSDFINNPKTRDIIVWDGVEYRIIDSSDHLLFDKCAGKMRNLVLAYDLKEQVGLYRNTFGVVAGGRARGIPDALADPVNARVQPMDQGEIMEFAVTKLERRYNVILETELDMLQSDQIRLSDGRVLEVDRCLDKECLELLSRIEAVDRGARWQA